MTPTPPPRLPFYRAFEDRYRGTRDTIKDRLRAYAPFTAPLLAAAPAAALDLGCGRGEWLELLGEQGFAARGVDLDEGMLAACRERGLAVLNQDALAALRAQADDSLALVSSFHLVEHLPFALVQELIAEALRVLQPGGLLIMETPNPENLTVGATSFYMDPTHLHPLPPALLCFAAEHAGYARSKVVRLQEDARLHGDGPVSLMSVLEGVSPDYAVVAQKRAAPPQLAAFDAAFARDYGIALGAIAERYEQQLAQQHAAIHRLLQGTRHSVDEAGAAIGLLRQQQAAHDAQLAAQRAELAAQEQRIVRAEAMAQAMGQRVIDLQLSTSWRVTAPLRRIGGLVHRLRAARREGRIGSALRWRALALARRAGQAVLRRPRLKRAARALLRLAPGLQARLFNLVHDAGGAGARLAEHDGPGLSPRSARVLRELKALQVRKNDAHRH